MDTSKNHKNDLIKTIETFKLTVYRERLLNFYEQALLMTLPCLLLNETKKLLLHFVGTILSNAKILDYLQ